MDRWCSTVLGNRGRSERAALQTAELLESKGYHTGVEQRPEVGSWATLASIETVISAESITEQRELLTELAGAGDGEYDGWGTPL